MTLTELTGERFVFLVVKLSSPPHRLMLMKSCGLISTLLFQKVLLCLYASRQHYLAFTNFSLNSLNCQQVPLRLITQLHQSG